MAAIPAETPFAAPWRRLAITLLAAVAPQLMQRVPLPGLDSFRLRELARLGGGSLDLGSLSVMALGIMPAISGFMLVEFAALLWPRWRPLRIGAPAGRARLHRAAMVVTALITVVQAVFIARYLLGAELIDGVPQAAVCVVTLAAGTFALIGLTQLVDRAGLACGFSLLLASGVLPHALHLVDRVLHPAPSADSAAPIAPRMALGVVILVATSVWTFTRYRTRAAGAAAARALRDPTSGLVPLVDAASLLMLPATLAAMGLPVGGALLLAPGTTLYQVADVVLVAGLCALYTLLFNRPRHVLAMLGRQGSAVCHREIVRQLWLGGARSLVLLLVLLGVSAWLPYDLRVDAALVAATTAVVMDGVAEWRARRAHGDLVSVWVLHRVFAVNTAREVLAAAGIPAHPRCVIHRSLYHFFGPYLPIDLMVPRGSEAEAVRHLAGLFTAPETGAGYSGNM
jgi:preprotein translocase subunit SecY